VLVCNDEVLDGTDGLPLQDTRLFDDKTVHRSGKHNSRRHAYMPKSTAGTPDKDLDAFVCCVKEAVETPEHKAKGYKFTWAGDEEGPVYFGAGRKHIQFTASRPPADGTASDDTLLMKSCQLRMNACAVDGKVVLESKSHSGTDFLELQMLSEINEQVLTDWDWAVMPACLQ